MRKNLFRFSALILAALIVCSLAPFVPAAERTHTAVILFTHDLHSHFMPQAEEDGGTFGGYARLKTAIDEEREEHPGALLVDGGDFSIGSLIQTLYTTQAAELRTMGALGYDAAALGNHEFDHAGTGLASMLEAATDSGGPLPVLLNANYRPAEGNPDQGRILEAMDRYGVREAMILERDGVRYGIFGLMGEDSHDCAPTSGFALENMALAAERCVADLKAQGAQFVICLSHSGTLEGRGEDYELARAVDGIDLIVSGHTHTTLGQPIVVNGTYIVSAGPYCRNLGSITLSWSESGGKTLEDYRLIPIDETRPEDPAIAALVEGWKEQVGETYLKGYGLTYDQVLTVSGFGLPTPRSGVQEGNSLGELVADAFLYVAKTVDQAAGREYQPTVAVTADGVLRAGLAAGEITVSQAFDVLSMGVGSDGTSGFPLVAVYLTGAELRDALEVDASVAPIMPAAQLYCAGVRYAFNPHRIFFNRVTGAQLCEETVRTEPASAAGSAGDSEEFGYVVTYRDVTHSEIDDRRLYRVVTGMYSAQMLGTVKSKSRGLLSLEPKMADGSPVTDFNDCILRNENGSEIKEWYALARYLQFFGGEGIPDRYAAPDGRKQVSRSWSPVEILKNPNWITLLVLAMILLAGAAVIYTVCRIAHRRRQRKNQ